MPDFVLVRYRTVNSDSVPIIKVVMEDYQKEDWVSLYQSALIELEQAKMSGRISAAQRAIVARVKSSAPCPDCILKSVRQSKMRYVG
jgi:hypothetical protein